MTSSTTVDVMQYYLYRGGTSYGPYTEEQIVAYQREGMLAPDDLFWDVTSSSWLPIHLAPCLAVSEPSDLLPLKPDIGSKTSTHEEGQSSSATADKEESVTLPVAEAAQPLSSEELIPEESGYARPHPISNSRLLWAGGIGIVAHLVALLILTYTAGSVFHIEITKPKPPVEPPPLQVEMVEEPPPPPPAPPPPPDIPPPIPIPPIPPPQMDEPPPPPAPPIVPIEQPVVHQEIPNLAPPPMLPPPPEDPASPRPPSPPVTQARPTHVRPVQEPAPDVPTSNEAQDVGESDYLYAPPPDYPIDARRMHLQGTVVLLVSVSSSGDTIGVRIEQSSGVGSLDRSAQKAVAQYRFRVNRAKLLRVPISFQL